MLFFQQTLDSSLFDVIYFNTFHWIALRWIDLNVYLRKEFSSVIWRQGYNTLHWIALHWIDLIECLSQKRVLTGYLEGPLFSSVIIFQYTTLDRLFIWRHHYSVVWFENSLESIALNRFEWLSQKRVTRYLEAWIQYIAVNRFEWLSHLLSGGTIILWCEGGAANLKYKMFTLSFFDINNYWYNIIVVKTWMPTWKRIFLLIIKYHKS